MKQIIIKKILFLAICLLLFSCKDKEQTNKSNVISQNTKNNVVFSGDYEELLTIEIASKITRFEPSKARKSNPMKGMMGEILKYSWENGREFVKEKSVSNRKRVAYPRPDFVQISFVDFEADTESFLEFVDSETHPEVSKIEGIGEAAYWNSKNNSIEVYYKNVSFRGKVEVSNDDAINKEKTIELAKLIIKEKLK
ncbi:MAG: hypothetical protein PHW92_00675 [Lutibacter sp.]|nr:hypothetical protein [Lutibacter sp.]